jgi:hypothetical protein
MWASSFEFYVPGEAQVIELVVAFFDDLVVVDPNIAISRKNVDVGAGFPVRVRLTAVRVAKRDVHARKFLIL